MQRYLYIILILISSTALACPPEGDGGDPILNRLKNRTSIPQRPTAQTISTFLHNNTPDLHTRKFRSEFTAAQTAYVDAREKTGVMLEGYLLDAHQSGPETANCHQMEDRDFHVWLGERAGVDKREAKDLRAGSIVVEPTPQGQRAHSDWRLHILRKLVRDGARVRITGWLMYDPEHPDQLGRTRATLWELHPVTKIEVQSGGRWREL